MGLRFAKRSTRLVALLGLAFFSVPERAMADTPGVTLRWSAPGGCPDEASVRDRVRTLAGTAVTLEADAAVTHAGAEYRASVRVNVGGSVGERALTAASCDELAESVAVLIALSATSLPEPPPPPPMPPPPVAPPPPVPPPVAPPAVAPPGRPHVRIAALGSIDVGTLPSLTYGGELRVSFLPARIVALGLAGDAWANQSGTLAKDPKQGADFSLLTLDASVCVALLGRGALDLSPCAVVEVARSTGSGNSATPNAASSTAVWVSVGGSLAARWELSRRFALVVSVDALVPTAHEEFLIAGGGPVHTIGIVAGRAHFGPEVRF